MQQNQTIQNQPLENVHNKPEKKFRVGALSISVWKNAAVKDGKTVEYKTISLGRSYKKNGVWQNTSASLRVHDIPKLSVMLTEAYKYLILQPSAELAGGEESIVM